jgi:DNA repair exonuclease SbcCD ATPase subunit
LHKKQQIQLLTTKKQQKQNDFGKIFPDQTVPDFYNNYEKLELEQQQLSNKIMEQNNYKNRLQNIDKQILSFSKQQKQIQNLIHSLETLLNQLTNEKQNLSTIFEQESKLKSQFEYQQSIQQLYFQYSDFVNAQEKQIRLKNEIRVQNYIKQSNENQIVANDHFLKKIQEAESVSLNKCIDNVNFRINEYLDKFFPNDAILVNIVSFKDTLKKDIKPGINIEVSYKGEDVELTSLSGGEYDRVALAIMLAFNSMSKSNLILLDESIASLDSELTNDILEKLKTEMNEQSSTKMIIVVAHQLSTGVFDQIISTIA